MRHYHCDLCIFCTAMERFINHFLPVSHALKLLCIKFEMNWLKRTIKNTFCFCMEDWCWSVRAPSTGEVQLILTILLLGTGKVQYYKWCGLKMLVNSVSDGINCYPVSIPTNNYNNWDPIRDLEVILQLPTYWLSTVVSSPSHVITGLWILPTNNSTHSR